MKRIKRAGHGSGRNAGVSAVSPAGFIYIYSALCPPDHLGRLGQFVRFGHFEQNPATAAPYPPVGCAAVELPRAAAFRAFGDDLHRRSPVNDSGGHRIRKSYIHQSSASPPDQIPSGNAVSRTNVIF